MKDFQKAVQLVKAGNIEKLQLLLNKTVGLVNHRPEPDRQGNQNTLLHEAVGMGEMKWPENVQLVISTLIKNGAEVDAREKLNSGETALHHAVSIGNFKAVKQLLKQKANIELNGRHDGSIDNALGYTLFYGTDSRLKGQKYIIDFLLEKGVELKLPFAAALKNHIEFEIIFNEWKTKFDNVFQMKQTVQQALLFAAKYGKSDNCHILIINGAKINLLTPFFHYKVTALHLAVESAYGYQAIKILLQHGADCNIKDDYFKATPINWALHCKQHLALKILKEHSQLS